MAEPERPDHPDADKVVRVGPISIGLRRRREPIREWRKAGEARDRLIAALAETGPVRFARWLAGLGARPKGGGET